MSERDEGDRQEAGREDVEVQEMIDGVAPIVDPPDPARACLEMLEYATGSEAAILAGVASGDFDAARAELDKAKRTVGESNDLGCLYAWLAYFDQPRYWPRALDTLARLNGKRAERNWERVDEASGHQAG
jgi:hypothetical protein